MRRRVLCELRQSCLEVCVVLICGCSQTIDPAISNRKRNPVTPLILEENEGEQRVVRGWPGHPNPGETFTIKVDPQNGGSSHMVLFTADIAPGGAIHAHRHPHADEILYIESGTARVHLGDSVRDVHAGATVFIPAGTWISAENTGNEPISMSAIFSAPGFEDFMRAGSVREGEKNVPLTEAENDQIEKAHLGDVVYKEP